MAYPRAKAGICNQDFFDIPKPIRFPLQKAVVKLGEGLCVFAVWKDVTNGVLSCLRFGSVSRPLVQGD